jgi:hypothetical protein
VAHLVIRYSQFKVVVYKMVCRKKLAGVAERHTSHTHGISKLMKETPNTGKDTAFENSKLTNVFLDVGTS